MQEFQFTYRFVRKYSREDLLFALEQLRKGNIVIEKLYDTLATRLLFCSPPFDFWVFDAEQTVGLHVICSQMENLIGK